jgi:AcrR family transcriptional regulator
MTLARKTRGMRRNLKEEERREQLRQAAIKVFSTRGYPQATLDDLVREAGVSKSLLYWYWDGKAALMAELIDTCLEAYKTLFREALAGEEPFGDRLQEALCNYVGLYRKHDQLNKLVHFCSLHHDKKADQDFGAQVDTHYADILDLLAQLIHQGQSEGYFRRDLDVSATATGLLALVEGHIYLSILDERMPLERILLPIISSLTASWGLASGTEP